ncbi:hypothetical protein D3C72_2509480 [compost metagenome]
MGAHDVEEAGDGRPVTVLVDAQDPLLGDLVNANQQQGPDQPGPVRGLAGCASGEGNRRVHDKPLGND